jgi:guanylate kinase
VDYHFVTPERFAALVAEGAFAEWAEVHGRRYGTLRATVEQTLRARGIAVFDIDVQGGQQLQAAFPREALTVFILPPDEAELARRLRGRSTESEAAIEARLVAARAEVARGLAGYQYVLLNDRLDEALARLELIVAAARARLAGAPDPISESAAAQWRREVAPRGGWRVPAGA